jgi:DHA1 family multidrug resistance protein-like MFS transporter
LKRYENFSDSWKNPKNWPIYKKLFVTFQICFLTLSVYIGSAIYTAGLQGVPEHFNVSAVAALLGLTVFVLGYATGPMFLVPNLICSSIPAAAN